MSARRRATWGRRVRGLALAAGLVGLPDAASARDGDSLGVTLATRLSTGTPWKVVLRDPIAYVGLDTGLEILDVSSPTGPVVLGHLYLPSPAYDLDVQGSLAYVANGESGLAVVDVSQPGSPVLAGRLATSGTRGVTVSGSIAYLAEASEPPAAVYGLRTVDVSVPTAPAAIGFAPLANGALTVSVAGGRAYVGIGSVLQNPAHGLAILDVSVPVAPAPLGFLATGKAVNAIAVAGGVAYLAAGFAQTGALIAADVAVASAPAILATRPLDDAAMGLALSGTRLFVAARSLGLLSFDVTDPAAPVAGDALPTGRDTVAVAARGDVAFLGERAATAPAFTTVSTPPPPGLLLELHALTFAAATDVALLGNTGYFLWHDALRAYDLSQPAQPVLLGSFVPPGAGLVAMDVQGTIGAVAQGADVRLVDLSDPATPAELGVVSVSSGIAVRPVLDAATLYVLTGLGLEVHDISDPTQPVVLAKLPTAGWSADLAVDQARAYLVAGSELEVIDVSQPSSPVVVGSLNLGDQLYGVAAHGSLAVVSGLANLVYAVDVSNPAKPVLRGALGGGPGFDLRLVGDRALVAGGAAGLRIVDVSSPAAPALVAYHDTSGSAAAVASDGPRVLLATGAAQQWILGCDDCQAQAPTCSVTPDLTSPDPDVCEGTPVDLDGSGTTSSGCAGGTLVYRWLEEGVPVAGATASTYQVPGTHAPGAYRFTVEATCSTDPSCRSSRFLDVTISPETWPTIAPNSLKVVKPVSAATFTWAIAAGSGGANLHLTKVRSAIPLLYADSASEVATTPSTSVVEGTVPAPGAPDFYQVYPRKSCSLASAGP